MTRRVYLKPAKDARVVSWHPWVFASDVERVEREVVSGDVVQVLSARGKPLGQALYNAQSQIRLRMLASVEEVVDGAFIRRRVSKAIALRRQLGDLAACRLINAESDRLPAVTADLFDGVISLQILSLGMSRFRQELVDALVEEIRPRGIWERNDVPVLALEGMEQSTGLLYGKVPARVEIKENGVRMLVDVKQGQKTGYFLDQKENRAAIAPYCRDARVLDICTHTGSFALHAKTYGAREVTAVDLSAPALDLAAQNARLNGFEDVQLVNANAFDYLRQQSDKGETYDLIVLDPPAFAKNKASLAGAARGYKEINLRAMKMLADGGILVSCSCSQAMAPELFLNTLREAAGDARVTLQQLEWRGPARDHPSLPAAPETNYLKCGIFRVLR